MDECYISFSTSVRGGFQSQGGGADPYAPRPPAGGDLYLDWTAGIDGSGTSISPYNTLTKSRVQSLSAGQSLWVKGTGAWPDVDGSGAATATALTRVQIAKWPGYSGGFTFSGDGQKLNGAAYWDFNGLSLSCAYNGMCLGENYSFSGTTVVSTNIRFIDCIGSRSTNTPTDNSGVIFGTNGSWPVSVIRGSYTGVAGASGNQALLWFDYPNDVTILGVLLDTAARPLYFKHTNQTAQANQLCTIKNCIIRNSGLGFGGQMNWMQITNNSWDACDLNLDTSGGGISGGNNCTITNNTMLNSSVTMAITDSGANTHLNNTFRNNAYLGTSQYQDNPFGGNSNQDQNNSTDYSATGSSVYYRNSTTYSQSGYHSAFTTQETNGVAGSMTLVGGSSPGSTATNWAMASGVAIGAGNDGKDCGVDATKLLTVN